MSNRLVRVGELLKREIGACIERDFDFRDLLVTVHDVVVSPDLRNADVYVGIIGASEGKQKEAVERLDSNRGMIQSRVMKRVVLKYTPRLHFHADSSVARGVDVINLLDSMAENSEIDESEVLNSEAEVEADD